VRPFRFALCGSGGTTANLIVALRAPFGRNRSRPSRSPLIESGLTGAPYLASAFTLSVISGTAAKRSATSP